MEVSASGDYPAHMLSREPAPPYVGEGEFALWHLSEDPGLERFVPRRTPTNPDEPPLVWAVDTRHVPVYWFPRDCPRGCIWPVSTTTDADRERFFGQTAATRVHVMEQAWLAPLRQCRLYAYRLPPQGFAPHATGGYWVSDTATVALARIAVGDLLECHAQAGIELRVTPSLWAFWDRVVGSTVEFSGVRLQRAVRHSAG
jgi:hypothetical protein